MCCRDNSTGTWEELLCFHKGVPLPLSKALCHYSPGFKENCFPSGITLDCICAKASQTKRKQISFQGGCNRACHCLLSIHMVYLLGPGMKRTLQKQKWWGTRKEEEHWDSRGSAPIFWPICPFIGSKSEATQMRYWIKSALLHSRRQQWTLRRQRNQLSYWFMSCRFGFGI